MRQKNAPDSGGQPTPPISGEIVWEQFGNNLRTIWELVVTHFFRVNTIADLLDCSSAL